MELNYLKEFVTLTQTENFLEAADQLFIAQSTLSKHIKSLERSLGVQLFARTTRKVALTRYGELLLPYARQILLLQESFGNELLSRLEQEQNSLEIGSIPALAQYQISNLLMQFKKQHPNIALNITQAGTEELKALLLAGKCEVAFLREIEVVNDEFARIPYNMDALTAVLPVGHPYVGRSCVPLSELRQADLLFLEQQTMLYNLSYEACRESGFEPKVVFTDHRPEHLVDFVEKGFGVALLMKGLAVFLDNPRVAVVDLIPSKVTHINLCYRKDAKLSPAAGYFLQCAREAVALR